METETIEAPAEISRESLLAEAHKADNEIAQEEGFEGAQTETPERTAGEEPVKPEAEKDGKTPESSEIKPETPEAKAERERDEKGRFKPKAEEIKPDSAYEKAKKEDERRKNVLANFEAEKQKARAEIEAERKAVEADKAKLQQVQAQQRPEATKNGFTAREYYQAAQDFAKAGDHEAAYQALVTAQEIRGYENRYFQQQAQQQSHKSYESAWQDQMTKSFTADPDTDPNSGSPLSGVISSLLEAYPEAFWIKDGFIRIVDTAKKLVDAGSVSELRKQLEQVQADLAEARKATQPAKGGSSSPSTPKNFENMSSEEMRTALIEDAERRDQESYAA